MQTMSGDKSRIGKGSRVPGKPYDLTKETSRRDGDSGATGEVRKAENDEVNEETNLGLVSSPDGDSAGENRVSTSISDD